jgi:hypothetical protein
VGEWSWRNVDFFVFSVAVKEQCSDADGEEEYYFQSGCSAS